MKRILLISHLLLYCLLPAFAQRSTRLANNWEFVKQDLGGPWEAVRPQTAGGPETLPVWEKVSLPHCFNMRDAVDPDMNYYQGPGWYRTQLTIVNPYPAGRTVLHFEGAGQRTDVYVYTKKIGSHLGGYDEWTVDITDAIEAFRNDPAAKRFKGRIPLEVRCDNSRDPETIPSQLSDFNVYGGIYRHLNLVYLPPVSVDKLFANATLSADQRTGSLNPRLSFYSPGLSTNVSGQLAVKDNSGKTVARQAFDVKLKANDTTALKLAKMVLSKPHAWSPDAPYLYTIEVTGKAGDQAFTHVEKIGFRNFLFAEKGPFYLNGKRLLLRGTHRHEDHAGVAAAMTDSMMLDEMQLIRDMGANFIRLGHYQQSRRILQLCDSLGIIVWEEIPWCRGGLGGDAYKAQARAMLNNMISQHYNHPAVILWGLGNENDWEGDFPEFDKQKIRAFMTELNNLAHKLDPSRKTTIRRCDFCKDIPDVYSPSIWAGWYRGVYTEYKKTTEEEFNKVPHFFHAEWGGDSHAGRHSENPDKALAAIKTGNGNDERSGDASLIGGAARVSKDGDWSESYICNLFDWHLKEQETMPWLTGSAFWVFKDFSTPIRPDNPIPYMNQKGVVTRDLTKKESYYVFQSYWSAKPMAHIYGHTWPTRWGDAGEQKMVKVYSNADNAELFVNGKSYGVKQRNAQDFPAAGLRWLVRYQEGLNKLRVVAHKGKVTVIDTLTQSYQTAKWGKPAKLVLTRLPGSGNTVTIQVMAYDSNGVPCLDAANWVRFSLAGDGTLLDDLGTPNGSRKVQLYNGRAVISIKLNGGQSVAAVSSQGLLTATLSL